MYDLVHWVDCTRDDVRDALAARLDDDDEMVREHAIAGLARSEAGWAIVGAGKPLPEVRIGSGQREWLAFRCIAAHDGYVPVAVVVRGEYAAWSGLADVAPSEWPRWRRAAGRYADEHTPFNMRADADLHARIRLGWHSDGVPEVTCRIGTRGKHWHERLSFCWQLQPDDVDRMCQGLADACEWLHASSASASPAGNAL